MVVQIVSVFPDVEGEDGFEAVGYRVVGVGVLGDGQGTRSVGLEPDPAGAEEAYALGFEVGFEGIDTPPLLDNGR